MPIETTTPIDTPAFQESLQRLKPQLGRIPIESARPIRLDIPLAITTALGVLSRAMELRPAVVAAFGEAAARPIDGLADASRALGAAHADHLTLTNGVRIEIFAREVFETRGILFGEAQSLVTRRLLEGNLLAELKGGTSYRDLAFDVLQLVMAFRNAWVKISGRTPVTLADLDRADAQAHRLVTMIGEQEQALAGSSPSGVLRAQAYEHFTSTYDEVRRLATYVRWHVGDADTQVPSLFAGRKASAKDDEEAVLMPPVAPTNGAAPVKPGLPGASPFAPSSS